MIKGQIKAVCKNIGNLQAVTGICSVNNSNSKLPKVVTTVARTGMMNR